MSRCRLELEPAQTEIYLAGGKAQVEVILSEQA